MLVCDVMTRDVRTVAPDATLLSAAQAMASLGVGGLPVSDGKQLLGMLTDRDIVVRGLASAKDQHAKVAECMSGEVAYVYEDEDTKAALSRMRALQIRRLIVLRRDKTLAGIVAIGDIATEPDAATCDQVGGALARISDPSSPRK